MLVYELAYLLKKQVSEIYANMTNEEFRGWQYYFSVRPHGWRDDDRAYKMMSADGMKAKPSDVFKSLEPIYNPPTVGPVKEGLFTSSAIKSSSFFNVLSKSIGGANIEL